MANLKLICNKVVSKLGNVYKLGHIYKLGNTQHGAEETSIHSILPLLWAQQSPHTHQTVTANVYKPQGWLAVERRL